MDEAVKAARKPLLEAARDRAISDMCEKARQVALQSGADPATLQIVEQEEVGLSYLPGSATRIKVNIRPKVKVSACTGVRVSVSGCKKLISTLIKIVLVIVHELCESGGGHPSCPSYQPHGFRGHKTILNHVHALVSPCP